MSAVLFDTLRRSRTLREKGHFTAERAEALAEALGDTAQDNLATTAGISALKADARETELRLEAKIDAVKSSLELKIEAVRSSLGSTIDAR